ncbi:MAG TPA: hypothetical protein VG015_07770 [Candidatus Dormibacteraeota bacterium]|jgi:hypothetical protein|nr:hypothetical protein [Candidatus Dormibacteraeota bacterium]
MTGSGRRRPSWIWLFFWGRKRGGFPWLMVVVVLLPIGLAISYSMPGGVGGTRWVGIAFTAVVVLVTITALGAGLWALFQSRSRRR